MNRHRVLMVLISIATGAAAGGTATATLDFDPTEGYSVTPVWSGPDAAHFAVQGDSYYIYGRQDIGEGQYQNVVRLYDGLTTSDVARSPAFAENEYSPDAITATANGAVYWAHARSFSSAIIYKSTYDLQQQQWETVPVLDESADLLVYGLSTNGSYVFGTAAVYDPDTQVYDNQAFCIDDDDVYHQLVIMPGQYSGGSGFDPEGNFYAAAGDGHVYTYSAQQVADRLNGVHTEPYAPGEAIDDFFIQYGTGSPVMESDGLSLFGSVYKGDWTGMDPYAYDLDDDESMTMLGVMSGGAAASVATDLYARNGAVYFMGKNDWTCGTEAVIYRLVPEPASLCLLVGSLALAARRRR